MKTSDLLSEIINDLTRLWNNGSLFGTAPAFALTLLPDNSAGLNDRRNAVASNPVDGPDSRQNRR